MSASITNAADRRSYILNFIQGYYADHGIVPSLREIQGAVTARFGERASTSTLARDMAALETNGLIKGYGTKARAYRLVPGDELRIVLPAGLRPDQRCAAEDRLRMALVEYMEDQRV